MNSQKPILFENGLMNVKVQWEDVNITVPFDLTNSHDIILYKAFCGMQEKISKMQSQIDSLQEKRESYLLVQNSLKEVWDNKKDDIWNDF